MAEEHDVRAFFRKIVEGTTPEVKKILVKKTCLELMFTLHVQESLTAVLLAIRNGNPIHMSKDQHERWKTYSLANGWDSEKLKPWGDPPYYSKSPSAAFEQLITLAQNVGTLPDGKLKSVPGLENLTAALETLRLPGLG
jgi:hypothetical protein